MPLSIRDLIWLRAYREQRDKNEHDLEKVKLDITLEIEKQRRLMLADIRYLCMVSLGITSEADAKRLWYSLPSMADQKMESRLVGRSRGVPPGKK